MRTTKHTPGPWNIEQGTNGFCKTWQVTHVSTYKAKMVADCGAIQTVNHNDKADIRVSEENIANARLIAAAPELLEALETLLVATKKTAYSAGDISDLEIELICAQKDAAKAIAKARGEL